MTKTFNILQKVRKRWEMEETALIWRWLPAFPCGKACTAAPAEPRNDKSGGQLHPEGRIGKLAIASLPCHCEEGASPTRQSQVGTFDFAGAFPCSGRYCEIAAPCSARLAMTSQETCRVRGQGGRQGVCIARLKAIGVWGKCRRKLPHFPHTPRMRLHPAPKNRGWVTDFADQISR